MALKRSRPAPPCQAATGPIRNSSPASERINIPDLTKSQADFIAC